MSKPFINKYIDLLLGSGISLTTINKLQKCWKQPWRFYHNETHLSDILDKLELYKSESFYNRLVLAAFFHDVQYNPWDISNNEDISISIFKKSINTQDNELINDVCSIIESTKHREIPTNPLCKIFWLIDNDILLNGTLLELIDYEHKIFKEFQFVDYSIYKDKRIDFLKSCIGKYKWYNYETYIDKEIDNRISELIKYIENRVINVGVYAGSFNPITIGHFSIIEKSEEIFDKVIIARGINSSKNDNDKWNIPTDWRQIEEYDGLISKYISTKESKNVRVTLIRGLRNGHDLDYEMNQIRHIQKLKTNLKTIFIHCDKEVEEISSSAVRTLLSINDDDAIELANSYIYNGIKNYINYL